MESQFSSHDAPFNYVLIDNHFLSMVKASSGWVNRMSGPSYSRLRLPQIGRGREITFGHRDFHLPVHFGFTLICVTCAGVARWQKYFYRLLNFHYSLTAYSTITSYFAPSRHRTWRVQLPFVMRCFVRLMTALSTSTHHSKFIMAGIRWIVHDLKQKRHGFRFA